VGAYGDRSGLDDWLTTLLSPRRRFGRANGAGGANGAVATAVKEPPARPAPAAPEADAARLAAVQAKLAQAATALSGANAMRTAVMDLLVDRHDQPAAAAVAERRRLLPLVVLAVVCALATAGALATVLTRDPAAPPPAAPQPCSPGVVGTCTTGTTLTIAPAGGALSLPGTEARVIGVAGETVRLHLRNTTSTSQTLADRVYVSQRGQRTDPTSLTGAVPPGESRTLSLRFPGTTGAADLGVVPFDEPLDRPSRLGVFRVTLR
jgi:hypothetical protein